MTHARELLSKQETIIANYVAMAKKYGKEAALQQLDLLGIDRLAFEKIEIPRVRQSDLTTLPAAMIGHGNSQQIANTPDAEDQLMPVLAGANGKDHLVNPTPGQGKK